MRSMSYWNLFIKRSTCNDICKILFNIKCHNTFTGLNKHITAVNASHFCRIVLFEGKYIGCNVNVFEIKFLNWWRNLLWRDFRLKFEPHHRNLYSLLPIEINSRQWLVFVSLERKIKSSVFIWKTTIWWCL